MGKMNMLSGKASLTGRVISAIGFLGSAQAVNIACSVLRNKLMAIWVGPAGVGLNSILVSASTLISTATQLNIRDSAVRDLSTPMEKIALETKTAVVRRWSMLLGLLGALCAIVLSPVLSAMAYDGAISHAIDFALLAPAIFAGAYAAGEFAILQSQDRLKAIAKANLTGGLAATAVSLPLIYLLRLQSIVYVIDIYAAAIALAVFFIRQRRDRDIKLPKLGLRLLWREGRSFIGLGVSISVSVLLASLANYIFSAYISSKSGEAALGIYQSGFTLVNSYVGIIFSAIAVEYFPRLTRFVKRPSMARTIMAHEMALVIKLVTVVAVIFVLLSEFIVRWLYSAEFEGVVPFVTYAIVGAVFRGISLCYAYRILAAGDAKAYIFTESISVAAGLALNIIAYNHWSYAGLGVSYIIWYAFYTLLTAAVCHRRYGLKLPGKLIPLTIASVAIITAAIAIRTCL